MDLSLMEGNGGDGELKNKYVNRVDKHLGEK